MDFEGIHVVVTGGMTGLIPEWVSDKRMGCEVTIGLPKKWYKDDNFLGFALFFHFVHLPSDDDQASFNIPLRCYEFSISQGDQFILVSGFRLNFNIINYYKEGFESLGVSFFPIIGIPNEYRSKGWNYFKASFYYKPFNMKSCGMHLIYAQAQDDCNS